MYDSQVDSCSHHSQVGETGIQAMKVRTASRPEYEPKVSIPYMQVVQILLPSDVENSFAPK